MYEEPSNKGFFVVCRRKEGALVASQEKKAVTRPRDMRQREYGTRIIHNHHQSYMWRIIFQVQPEVRGQVESKTYIIISRQCLHNYNAQKFYTYRASLHYVYTYYQYVASEIYRKKKKMQVAD